MLADFGAEHASNLLGAETDTDEWTIARKSDALKPVEFCPNAVEVIIIGAHRAPKDHRGGIVVEILRQGIAKIGTTAVKRVAAVDQAFPDLARRGMLLMDDDENLLGHECNLLCKASAKDVYLPHFVIAKLVPSCCDLTTNLGVMGKGMDA
jgi:hypothetical protein